MRSIHPEKRFQRDIKRLARSGKYDILELTRIIRLLANDTPLEPRHKDHALSGNLSGVRDCHIKGDWVLLYILKPGELILVRTGTHSEVRI